MEQRFSESPAATTTSPLPESPTLMSVSRLASIEALIRQEIDRVNATLPGHLRHKGEIQNKISPNGWRDLIEEYPDVVQFAELRALHAMLGTVRWMMNRRSFDGQGLPQFAPQRGQSEWEKR